jgi:hypothetical protein
LNEKNIKTKNQSWWEDEEGNAYFDHAVGIDPMEVWP